MTDWTAKYGCHSLRIGDGALTIEVQYDKGGYTVSCGNRKLKDVFVGLDAAKAAGIFLARKIVDLADADLDAAAKQVEKSANRDGA